MNSFTVGNFKDWCISTFQVLNRYKARFYLFHHIKATFKHFQRKVSVLKNGINGFICAGDSSRTRVKSSNLSLLVRIRVQVRVLACESQCDSESAKNSGPEGSRVRLELEFCNTASGGRIPSNSMGIYENYTL